jgi:hypothetical protein
LLQCGYLRVHGKSQGTVGSQEDSHLRYARLGCSLNDWGDILGSEINDSKEEDWMLIDILTV